MLTLHPVVGKQKAVDICNAFAAGAPKDADGDVFFGVNYGNIKVLRCAKAQMRDWYYVDNAYIDRWRGKYFRVTKNALQCSGAGESDGKRFAALDVEVKPWRETLGPEILLCPQSDSFMHTAAGYKGSWTEDTLSLIESLGGDMKTVRVRPWSPDKIKVSVALLADLANLRLLVTHSSASAITAMFEGVPAISQRGAASLLTGQLSWDSIHKPPKPEGRMQFANVLADNQFTLEEMRDGTAWSKLQS